MSSTESIAIVLTTLGAGDDAQAFARTLVDERLAACVNILPPMMSVYSWNGRTEAEREQQLVIKTSSERLAALQARLLAQHPYDTPELIVLGATASDAYSRWLAESTEPRR